jgi:hypothetical protein
VQSQPNDNQSTVDAQPRGAKLTKQSKLLAEKASISLCNRHAPNTKLSKIYESQEFLHTWLRKVTIKPTSMPTTEKIKNALSVHDSRENEVSSNAHCIRNTQRQQN